MEMMGFSAFNFNPKIMATIKAQGYTEPTPVQAKAIPAVLDGRDVLALAQTGTGKTAAFVLPLLQRLAAGNSRHVRALIVVPTRELAQQVGEVVRVFGDPLGIRSTSIIGGASMGRQIDRLKRGVDVIIACPGRLLDHMERRNVDLSRIECLVLDEADQMFEMGFQPAIRSILKVLPIGRQTLLFSATMPSNIRRLAAEVMREPVEVKVNADAPTSTVSHALYPVRQDLKTKLLIGLLKHTDTESVLVFVRTKHRAKKVAEQLRATGLNVTSLQGNLSQGKRLEAMRGFRSGEYQIMVATDIAARGIDISSVSHVINYDIPDTTEAYTHRIGRTGRAAKQGDAFTLVAESDGGMVKAIERVLGAPIERRKLADFDYNGPGEPRMRGEAPKRRFGSGGGRSGRDRAAHGRGGNRGFRGGRRSERSGQYDSRA